VTIAKRPSEGGTARDIGVIWVSWEQQYLCKQDWTGQIILMLLDNLGRTSKARTASAIVVARGLLPARKAENPNHSTSVPEMADISFLNSPFPEAANRPLGRELIKREALAHVRF
jgi:hypothetical protein